MTRRGLALEASQSRPEVIIHKHSRAHRDPYTQTRRQIFFATSKIVF